MTEADCFQSDHPSNVAAESALRIKGTPRCLIPLSYGRGRPRHLSEKLRARGPDLDVHTESVEIALRAGVECDRFRFSRR